MVSALQLSATLGCALVVNLERCHRRERVCEYPLTVLPSCEMIRKPMGLGWNRWARIRGSWARQEEPCPRGATAHTRADARPRYRHRCLHHRSRPTRLASLRPRCPHERTEPSHVASNSFFTLLHLPPISLPSHPSSSTALASTYPPHIRFQHRPCHHRRGRPSSASSSRASSHIKATWVSDASFLPSRRSLLSTLRLESGCEDVSSRCALAKATRWIDR